VLELRVRDRVRGGVHANLNRGLDSGVRVVGGGVHANRNGGLVVVVRVVEGVHVEGTDRITFWLREGSEGFLF